MSSISEELLSLIRSENLNVYRASPNRLREDVGQECQISQDYRGRLVYELLQNADDAMVNGASSDCIRFELTDKELWVSNSGRPLDEEDIRGLCGISASKKATLGQKRRASIGHKGMGFKSVLEISETPEVYSTTISFRFSPKEALLGIQPLVSEGKLDNVSKAPTTRFPWPIDDPRKEWDELKNNGMNTAFRFPLREQMTAEQKSHLASVLRNLPVSSLVFLKHIERIEVKINRQSDTYFYACSVRRYYSDGSDWRIASGFDKSGDYLVSITPDDGSQESFLLSHDMDIQIAGHRGGIDEFTWESVEYTEVSVAARMREKQPVALESSWRNFHVFLPTGEPCPYDLLVSGAFSSNLSRQEIRVESDEINYNRFLFRQAARVLRERLFPKLIEGGAAVTNCLQLLNRRVEVRSLCTTAAAQVFYEDVTQVLADYVFLPGENSVLLSIKNCAVPPIVNKDEVGRSFRKLLQADALCGNLPLPSSDLCGESVARILVDHGAHMITPNEAALLLASADEFKSKLVAHTSGKVSVDPVLNVLEQLWRGLEWRERDQLVEAARREALFPVSIDDNNIVRRISTQNVTCFYPPRFLHKEVPLAGLCFLLQQVCWGDLTPKERNVELQRQMETWKAIFDIREFKFPEVMRASVLPALDLERDSDVRVERSALRDLNRLAAICQLAGRTPNANAPLPYERLKSNRALFNLSRLDVPCKGTSSDTVIWMPAYKAYFGIDWIGSDSVEQILNVGLELGVNDLPAPPFILGPDHFYGLLEQYQYLKVDEESEDQARDVGEDEVSIEEDEDSTLDSDDRARWMRFFQWLGVNMSMRPVHFHDVEDRASGWLKTEKLRKPEGWAFQNIPADLWNRYRQSLYKWLTEKDANRANETVAYFYELHDLEHLVKFANIASTERSARFAKALYEHLAHHWMTLEKYSRAVVAQISLLQEPTRRSKPPRAKEDELVDIGPNFWLFRLQDFPFCPTGHGPRRSNQTWLPTAEVQRRFRRGARAGSYPIPVLEVEPSALKGKSRAFAQVLGVREELSPASFSLTDARLLLDRLHFLYQEKCDANEDLHFDLSEVIRPAYRNLVELLSGKAENLDEQFTLGESLIIASDGCKKLRFLEARKVFYLERRDTRERLASEVPIWTFIIEANPAARIVFSRLFGMRVLEESLSWSPKPADLALGGDQIDEFRKGLYELAPYLLARVGADRVDERLARQDARRLRGFIDSVEPVTNMDLACSLDGQEISISEGSREAFVQIGSDEKVRAIVIWGENPWPPDQHESEILAGALCDVLGAGYFESFIALLQSESTAMRERILRRAGALMDIEEKKTLFFSINEKDSLAEENTTEQSSRIEPKTSVQVDSMEEPALAPTPIGGDRETGKRPNIPLYEPGDLIIEGVPVFIKSESFRNELRENLSGIPDGRTNGNRSVNVNYAGNTDLEKLDKLGMWVALTFERERLRHNGYPEAEVFDEKEPTSQDNGLIFNVSKPEFIENIRHKSNLFNTALKWLQEQFGIVPDWPGFDILTLDKRMPHNLDRLIELKSSGVDSRVQEMTWNEWKTAKESVLRDRFYLYLVGNLRSDLKAAVPFIRTVRNPVEQMITAVQTSLVTQKKVMLAVQEFKEAEYLNLTVRRPCDRSGKLV